jgi:CubicO group peptidase (beta-lactamase class C family)
MAMKTALFSLLAVCLAGCASAPPEAGPPAPSAALASVGEKLKTGAYGNTHALLVFKGGAPVAEFYAPGADQTIGANLGVVAFDASTLHDIRSISKSVVGLSFGVAYGEGKIGNLDTPVLDFFPEYAELQTPERRKITLRHMLTMTSGLAWDENTYPYTDPRNSEIAMGMAADPFRYVLSQKIAAPAGTKFQYSGGDVAILAEVLRRRVGMQVDVYADRVLFKPLGIAPYQWNGDRNGVPVCGVWAAFASARSCQDRIARARQGRVARQADRAGGVDRGCDHATRASQRRRGMRRALRLSLVARHDMQWSGQDHMDRGLRKRRTAALDRAGVGYDHRLPRRPLRSTTARSDEQRHLPRRADRGELALSDPFAWQCHRNDYVCEPNARRERQSVACERIQRRRRETREGNHAHEARDKTKQEHGALTHFRLSRDSPLRVSGESI